MAMLRTSTRVNRLLNCAAPLILGLAASLASAAAQPSAAIETVKASVVAVGTFQRTRNPQFRFLGTGFAVGDGTLIATNAHVVRAALDGGREPEYLVAMVPTREAHDAATARIMRVERVASDLGRDLALLRLAQGQLPPLKLRETDDAREGDALLFTGFPIGAVLGPFAATHRAMISAITPIAIPPPDSRQLKGAMIRQLQSGPFSIYQLDGTAYPGNSGSPMYDPATGEVIGIINMVFVKGMKENAITNPSGICYAIPIQHLRTLLATVR